MKLIHIEWMKLKRLNTMKVILLIYAMLVPTIFLCFSLIEIAGWKFPETIYSFPEVYHYVTYVSSWFNLMIGVIIIVFTTNELKYRTQRQNVIDGLSKKEIIMSKFYVVLLLSIVITLYTFLVAFIFGVINGSMGDLFDGLHYIGVYFISTLGYFVFAYFFANLIKLPALAIIFYLLSTFLEGIFGFISVKQYVQFFPLSTFSDLIPPPILPQGVDFIWGQGGRTAVAVVYILIFVATSYFVIRKRDI